MNRRLILAATLAITAPLMLGGATAQAASGSLRILFDSNQGDGDFTGFLPALAATPGVATVDTVTSFDSTPSEATLAGYDLVVDTGDSAYDDPVLYGDRLANYIDSGGAVIQFAYDNWDQINAHPAGRFESGSYPPFIPGPNDNAFTTLGTLVVPTSPLLAGVPTFTTQDNVTDALAPGATLLALWADGRNAIATKGRVTSVTASPEDGGDLDPIFAAARLAVNAGNALGRHTLTVKKAGPASASVTSVPAGINCGKTCAATFAGATSITLTAKAKGASTRWSGVAGCGKGSNCTFTPTADTTVTANFKCKKKKKKSSAESAKKKKCKKKKKS